MAILNTLRSGHWPSLAGAWLHFEVSFMTWLLIGSLGVSISEEFGLSPTQKGLLVACPLLSGALLRILVGLSSDRFGAKATGLYLLVGETGALMWGWLGGGSFAQLLGVGLLLGVAGASFAVALPIASRAYPPAYQGLAMGIAASANSGTVLAMFLAPRVADAVGWHGVFGATLGPVLMTAVVFAIMVRDDAQGGLRQPVNIWTQWWQDLRDGLTRPSMQWLCLLYAITFGGFVGVCSFLPIFLHDQYGFDRVTAGSLTAVGGLLGSFIRPLGGYVADRLGGIRVLPIVFAAIAAAVGGVGWLPEPSTSVVLLLTGLAAMGFGNGVVFQVVSDRFPKQMGLASGVIGAAGGIGGFFLPVGLGGLKDVTGTYATGLWCFALLAMGAWGSVVCVQRRGRLASG
ncbi:MAG TPA: MFS transporter [Nitrospira sp.]|nr:MFS transporter [Nitrospira sp.]